VCVCVSVGSVVSVFVASVARFSTPLNIPDFLYYSILRTRIITVAHCILPTSLFLQIML
jgi:hypothetical protein